LLSDALPFGRLSYGEPNAVSKHEGDFNEALKYSRFSAVADDDAVIKPPEQ
jgi:hypothetical protein